MIFTKYYFLILNIILLGLGSILFSCYNGKPSNPQDVIKFVDIIETESSEELLDTETRTIDNSKKGDGEITRTITITKEWSKTYLINSEKSLINGVEGIINFPVLNIKFQAEQEIRNKYEILKQKKESVTHTIQVKVPPGTKRTIPIRWINRYQNGKIKYFINNTLIYTPYKVLVDVTYDIDNNTQKLPIPSKISSVCPLNSGAYKAYVNTYEGLFLRPEPRRGSKRIASVVFMQTIVVLQDNILQDNQRWQEICVEGTGQKGWMKAGNVQKLEKSDLRESVNQ
ncbi:MULTISPECIES: hypothetical protein [Nostocales]|uniref:SH3b domain-containing protein n=2 Tax=Nostocales TaxID=1161 RepID=A0ABW8WZT9_9CYAN